VVVRLQDPTAIPRAADHLARAGAFGLLVLDLGDLGERPVVPMPLQSRLLGLAQKHSTAIVCLTEKPEQAPSLGSLISLHAIARRCRQPKGRLRCELEVIKDKRRAPTWTHAKECRGSAGLR
jgi:recombination protein RecA